MDIICLKRIGLFLFVLVCYSSGTWAIYDDDDDVDLHIAAIFPMKGTGGWLGGQGCLPAALMALKDVNRDRSLLPGYRLKMHWNDSECNPGLGASVMYDLLYKPPQKLMLLGGCSIVCSTVAEAAKMWNLVVISYGSSSPALSNRKRFPTFFRTHPSATIHNPTRIKLFQKFGWSRIAIIQEAEEVFISTSEDLEHRCKEAKIEIVTRQSFLTDVTDAVKNLVRQDARIIVGMFYGGAARRVLCEAYRQKVYGKQFVWFLIGWYEDDWYTMKDPNINCTVEQMKEAVEGHFTTEALMLNQDSKQTISGMTSQEFIHRYQKELNKMGYVDRRPEGYQEAPLAYDAIWAITLALNKTITQLGNDGIKLQDFTYTNSRIANEIYSAMNSTQFLGVSGHVAFSSKGDRMAWTQIEQMIDGEYRQLGFYDTQTDNLTWIRSEHWPDGRPPQDRTIIVEVLRTVSLGLFISMCSVAFIGITWAVGLLVFNWLFRHSRYIQLSHPMCNNILLTGIILCLLCVCFLGLDGQFVEEASFSHMCQARAWLLTLGFTLSYGAMFSKIWRVHRLTTKTNNENKKVESWKLYVLVGALLFLDIIILTTWQVVDPLQRKLEIFPQEEPEAGTERDIKIQPLLEHCESEYNAIWLGVLYSYKGLLLIFGIFLAYETRSVKIKQLNDSRLVGMSIYNVVVLCLITAPVTLVISSQQDATFAFVALAIIFCSFLSMALVFIPKIIELVRRPKERADARSLTDTISSKEEEERHQRLLLENEDFKRQIAQKEEEIQILTIKLREKQNLRSAHVLTTTQLGGGGGERVRICFEPQIMDGLLLPPSHKKDSISIDPVSDSGFVTGTSFARSSRASHSDFEFSESYL